MSDLEWRERQHFMRLSNACVAEQQAHMYNRGEKNKSKLYVVGMRQLSHGSAIRDRAAKSLWMSDGMRDR